MNDLTREELQFIWQRLCTANFDNTEMHDLPDKVCSMIDNYCEHEEMEFMEQENHEMLLTCKKCMRTDLL